MFGIQSFCSRFSGPGGKRILATLAILLSVSLGAGNPALARKTAPSQENPKYASIVMDADTGAILYARYADKPVHPASLTKIMTLLLVFDALEQNRLGLNDRLPVSSRAAAMAPSKLGLQPGSSIKVQDAIYALVTKSANDVAAVVAERLGGSERNFARMMTLKAHNLGMTRTFFTNASGLHDPTQLTTARDMALLARTVINTYPGYYRYFSRKTFSWSGQTFQNHNHLMETYRGMDGMKTGFIQPSGFNLVASAVRNNHRLIGVVFGGLSAGSRNAHMAALLDAGFTRVGREVRMARANTPASSAPVRQPNLQVAMNAPAAPANNNATASVKPANLKLTALEKDLQEGRFGELTGEGDSDPAASERIETGLMAISAVKGQGAFYQDAPAVRPDSWVIQVGAFQSRAATDKALVTARKALPASFTDAQPLIAPLKTKDGWIFRARLSGLTKTDAFKACRFLRECMPIPAP